MNPSDFISAVAPAARASAAKTKIPASFTVAQGALESGWGTSQLALQGFNLFGVKADPSWHGDTMKLPTAEYVNGQRVTVVATWRKYGSWLEAIDDRAAFLLNNPRYKPAFAYTSGPTFACAIAAAGYATDPKYGQKIVSIIKAHNLSTLDV
ncbi:glycoside hydrolase family 73 protein [Paraburkholderia terrae]|uniref:glycoside hydrolase family 73 protein n=1 Tax=Paraburkholderia terrae TaxID=311230 RepID=UPI00296AAC60|nr:glucosaminidase domain-containing protein [Paraburkholderia terrae]MDW3655485.1 glucosaminidase domain-containing protein [Paraburkholderia terrae]